MAQDKFQTLLKPAQALLKEKGSKFLAFAYPVENEAQIQEHLQLLRKKHHTANHVCYAYTTGFQDAISYANDDGEPSNSAGTPILGQIQSCTLSNVLLAVVRYFGGVKLGVGGLRQAYKTSAQMVLQEAAFKTYFLKSHFRVDFTYPQTKRVEQLIKKAQADIIESKFETTCYHIIAVRKSLEISTENLFLNHKNIQIKPQ